MEELKSKLQAIRDMIDEAISSCGEDSEDESEDMEESEPKEKSGKIEDLYRMVKGKKSDK